MPRASWGSPNVKNMTGVFYFALSPIVVLQQLAGILLFQLYLETELLKFNWLLCFTIQLQLCMSLKSAFFWRSAYTNCCCASINYKENKQNHTLPQNIFCWALTGSLKLCVWNLIFAFNSSIIQSFFLMPDCAWATKPSIRLFSRLETWRAVTCWLPKI